jgi:hypothetical protein
MSTTQSSTGFFIGEKLGKFGNNSLEKCDQISKEIVIQVMP